MRLIAPVVDLEHLSWFFKARPPPIAAVSAIRQSLDSASLWRVKNHTVAPQTVSRLREAGKQFFDQPARRKKLFTVGEMDRSRGWELYPQHWRHHHATMALGASQHVEPSAAEGIICERFVCGPPSICTDVHGRPSDPFYDSQFARVFYEHNVWPPENSSGGQLRRTMHETYAALEPVAAASLQCLAAACGMPHDAYDHLVATCSADHATAPFRHHSRLQLNNYPSQLLRNARSQQAPIRASRHLDTSLLTVLAREAASESAAIETSGHSRPRTSTNAAGSSGALEVQLPDESWACVPAAPGELTVFVGSITAALSGFSVRPTTHRVSNPHASRAADARRMSVGYVLKPDYSVPAVAESTFHSLVSDLGEEEATRAVPCVGLIGRVGWQNHAMQTRGISRLEAVSSFKLWKIDAFAKLKTLQEAQQQTQQQQRQPANRTTPPTC